MIGLDQERIMPNRHCSLSSLAQDETKEEGRWAPVLGNQTTVRNVVGHVPRYDSSIDAGG